ncbi:bifunctional diaminohydroxyphosphoribosylaminopyrimidine deaminase/5-amino-6-(5-phosphoribosylamino)uracil reductase RibD [Aliidiomarina sedimenti]|nr:bifunctional diaminohydroxyphosphoribosylaminopyrimidine deaminase/5-amino-6-(5-phosphoribosylamino)uracil reductase RibD [Aliidiomarina sedimenti]
MTETAAEFSPFDYSCMQEALRLAAVGRFTTSPNPNVGCVLVAAKSATEHSNESVNANEHILGRGFHAQAGTPHAEVHALAQAGSRAAGSTAYVTLEPCSHYGRTPPCADALIKAGVARVVVAMEDPYHQVAGSGIQRLREAGIAVDVGLMQAEARELNLGFIKRAEQGLPYVRVKLAASVDGRTALSNGHSQWITGVAARQDVQLGRALSSAVLTGAGTVLADDPLLNVRLTRDEYPTELSDDIDIRQPVRIVVDNSGAIGDSFKLWSAASPVWLARPHGLPKTPLPVHGEVLSVEGDTKSNASRIDLTALMKTLAQRDINDVWVEAGARLSGALLQQGLVDELIVYQAPKLMGPDAKGLIDLPEFTRMTDLPEWQFHSVQQVGEDIKLVLRPRK